MSHSYRMMLKCILKPPSIIALILISTAIYAQEDVAPIADAFATPTTGIAPLTVTLDGSGSYDPDGKIVDYQWNASDGQTTAGVKTTLTFKVAGSYDINLVVTDEFGSVNTNTALQTVKVNLPLDASPPLLNSPLHPLQVSHHSPFS